jgi:cell division protein FtsB
MRALKYLVSLWVAVIFYAAASTMVGAVGINAYASLDEEREKQEINLAALQSLNEELLGIEEALRYDEDTIAVYARDLGFGASEERFIRIVGFNEKHKQALDPGEALRAVDPTYVDDKTLRVIAAAIAVCLLLCIAVVDILQFVKNS